MTLQYKWLESDFATAAQIAAEDVAAIAAAGFRTIVNNRPDHEGGPAQPTSEAIERAAKAAGLDYAYLPVKSAMQTPAEVEAMEELLDRLPKPVLGFCRSGTRTANLYYRARARSDAR
ncbi:MAG TPA: TIGR01244 family sulfur transferase [Casimicrobiaceae bacterium]